MSQVRSGGGQYVVNDSVMNATQAHQLKDSAGMSHVVDSADTVQANVPFVRTQPGAPPVTAANGQPQK